MLIDCDNCAMRNIACADCVVTMLLDGPRPLAPSAPVEFDDDEWRAVDVLAEAGLVAPLRLIPLRATPNPEPRNRRSIAG